jgi:hypothetical protein
MSYFTDEELKELENSKNVLSLDPTPKPGTLEGSTIPKGLVGQKIFTDEELEEVSNSPGAALESMAAFGGSKVSSIKTETFRLPGEFGESQYDTQIKYAEQLQNLDDMRGQLQPLSDKIGNTAVKLIAGTGLNIAQVGPAVINTPEAILTLSTKPYLNSAAARTLDAWQEDITEAFPHYYTQAEREKGLMSQLATYNFWGDKLVNGVTFLAAAAITEVAMGLGTAGLGTLAAGPRISGYIARMSKLFGGMKGAASTRGMTAEALGALGRPASTAMGDIFTTSRQLVTGSVFEASIETRHAYDSMLDTMLEENYSERIKNAQSTAGREFTREEKLQLLSPEERSQMDEFATSHANVAFGMNMLLVGGSNMIMLGRLYGNGIMGRLTTTGSKAPKLNLLEKGLTKIGAGQGTVKAVSATTRWGGRMLYEGVVEEGGQGLISTAMDNYAFNAMRTDNGFQLELDDYLAGFGEAIGDQVMTKEGREQILIGAIIGGMGIPRKLKGSGLLMSGDYAAVGARMQALDDMNAYDRVLMDKITKHFKDRPEMANNQLQQFYLGMQLRNRIAAREKAEKDGDVYLSRNLENDDIFDHLMYLNETGQLKNAMKLFEDGLNVSDEEFRQNYQYDPTMTSEEILKRKSQLRESYREHVERVQQSTGQVDNVLRLTPEERYTDIAKDTSKAFQRRMMIRFLSAAKERDAREKKLNSDLAQMTGGTVISTEDMVDSIVIEDARGNRRVIRTGSLNTGATVGQQMIETKKRIAQLKQLRNPSTEVLEELDGLVALEDRLKAEKDLTRPVAGIMLESMNIKEEGTLKEWEAKDPIAAATEKEKVKTILNDLRKLRQDRVWFSETYLKITDPEGFQQAVAEWRRSVNAYNEEVLKNQQREKEAAEKVKKARQTKITTLKNRIKRYRERDLQDLVEAQTELSEQLESASQDLEYSLQLIAGLEENIQTAKEKLSRRKGQKKVRVEGKLVTLESLQEELSIAKEFQAEAQQKVNELKPRAEIAVQEVNDVNNALKLLEESNLTSDEMEEVAQVVRETWTSFAEDSSYQIGTEASKEFTGSKLEIMQLIAAHEETVKQLEITRDELQARIDAFDQLVLTAEDIMNSFAGTDPKADLSDLLKVAPDVKDRLLQQLQAVNMQLQAADTHRLELSDMENGYEALRTVQVFRKVMVSFEDKNDAVDLDAVEDLEMVPVDKKQEYDNYNKPDFQSVGFFKSTNRDHETVIAKYKELKDRTDLNALEKLELDRVNAQIRWYKWLHSSEDDENSPMQSYVKLMFINQDNVPEELKGYFKDKFYIKEGQTSSEELKIVAVRQNAEKGPDGKTVFYYTPVMEDGIPVHSSMMDHDISEEAIRKRFSGVDRVTSAQLTNELSTYNQFKQGAATSDKPWILPIKEKSQGSPVLQKEELITPNDAIRKSGGALANIPLVVAVPSLDAVGTSSINITGAFRTRNILSGSGKVWAYDALSGHYIPMERQNLSEEDALTVSRLFHLILKETDERVQAGIPLKQARKEAEKTALEHAEVSTTAIQQIRSLVQLVWNKENPSDYQLSFHMTGNDLGIWYGKGKSIGLDEFENDPKAVEDFLSFLRTKRYHVNKHDLKGTVVAEKQKQSKLFTGKFKAVDNNPWVKIVLDENLEVSSKSRKYKHYGESLLSGTGQSPALMTRVRPYKTSTLTEPTFLGGYVTFDKSLKKVTYVEKGSLRAAPKKATDVPVTMDPKGVEARDDQFGGGEQTMDDVLSTLETAPSEDVLKNATPISDEDLEILTGNNPSHSSPEAKKEVQDVKDSTAVRTFTSAMEEITDGGFGVVIRDSAGKIVADHENIFGEVTEAEQKRIDTIRAMNPYWNPNAMNTLQAGHPVFNAVMENVSEEIARAQKMTPLEVTLTEMILGSLDAPAVAQLRDYGQVLLSSFAPAGAVYHEAFHNVSLYILSKNDSDLLYRKVREIPGTVVTYLGETKNLSDLNNKEAEEWLAEEFRRWMLSGMTRKIGEVDVQDDRNIIRRFFDSVRLLLRRLFNLNDSFAFDPEVESIEGMFRSVEAGKFLKSVRNPQKGNQGVYNMLSSIEGMTSVQKSDAVRNLAAYVGYNLNREVEFAGKRSMVSITDLYTVLSGINSAKKSDVTRLLIKSYTDMLKVLETKKDSERIGTPAYEAANATYLLYLKNNNNILSLFKEYLPEVGFVLDNSASKNSQSDRLKKAEEDAQDDPTAKVEEETEVSSHDAAFDRGLGEESPTGTATGPVKLVLGTIMDSESTSTSGLQVPYEMSEVMQGVQQILQNSHDWKEVMSRLKAHEGNSKYPWIGELLSRVESIESELRQGSFDAAMFKSQLSAFFRKVHVAPFMTLVSETGRVYNMDPAIQKTLEKIKLEWSANLKQKATDTAFPFIRSVGGSLVFQDVPFSIQNQGGPLTVEKWIPVIQSMGIEGLLDTAETFGIVFSNRDLIETEESASFEESTVKKVLSDSLVSMIGDRFRSDDKLANMFSRRITGSGTRANALARMEFLYGKRRTELSYLGADGKMRYSLQDSTAISATANKPYDRLWHLQEDVNSYTKNSLTVNQMREAKTEDGTYYPIEIPVVTIEGLQVTEDASEGDKMVKLTPTDIASTHIQAIMDGVTVILRAADKSTELGVMLPIWDELAPTGKVWYGEPVQKVLLGYLEDEMVTAVRTGSLGYHVKYGKNEAELRFMKTFLSADTLKKVNGLIKKHTRTDRFSETAVRDAAKNLITELNREGLLIQEFRKRIEMDKTSLLNYMQEYSMIEAEGTTGWNLITINADAFGAQKEVGDRGITSKQMDELVTDVVLRHFIGKNEMFKTFLGDPALYSDMFKRIGGAVGSKILMETENDLIGYAISTSIGRTETKESVQRLPSSIASGKAKFISINELKGKVPDKLLEDIATYSAELAQAYDKDTDMADGTIFTTSDMYRVMEMGTSQWNHDRENVYQAALRGESITDIGEGGMTPAKMQYFGPAMVGSHVVNTFFKMSVVPLDETLGNFNGKRYVNYMNMLNYLRENDQDIVGIILPSAQKVGKPKDDYQVGHSVDKKGIRTFNDPLDTAIVTFDLSYMGSQMKVANEFKGKVINAVQAQAHLPADLFEGGMIAEAFKDQKEKIMALKSEFDQIRSEMTSRAFGSMLEKLDITRTEEGYLMTETSYSKLLDLLEEEGQKRDLGELLLSAIPVMKENPSDFRVEMFVEPTRMENTLFSALGKKVIRQKRAGDMFVQVSEAGYEVSQSLDASGTMQNTSSQLGFYKNPGSDGWVMEVMMPHHMKEFVRPVEGSDVTPDIQIIDGVLTMNGVALEDSQGLLDVIGIRIPTDGIHSIEIIRIKEFLPQHAGPVVVVPYELLVKAGSDFDIDKLVTYFKNYSYFNGRPREITYQNSLEALYLEKIQSAEQLVKETEELFEGKRLQETSDAVREMAESLGMLDTVSLESRERLRTKARKALEKLMVVEGDQIRYQTFEEWSQANPNAQTSTKALENRMIDIMKEILSIRGREVDFMRPVSLDLLEKLAEEVMGIAGKVHRIPNLASMSDYHEGTAFETVLRISSAAWQGKQDVGIFALGGTHHIKAQKANLQLDLTEFLTIQNADLTIKPKFHFSEFSENEKIISLARVWDRSPKDSPQRKKISDVISQLVNASVDNANKPVLHILNLGPKLAPAGLLLLRAGVPVRSVVFFMNQPAVRDYMTLLDSKRGKSLKAGGNQWSMQQIYQTVLEKYARTYSDVNPIKDKYFTEAQLQEMMPLTLDSPAFNKLSQEKQNRIKDSQLQILKDLMVYMELGQELSTATNVQAYDTKVAKSRHHARVMAIRYNQVLAKNRFINLESIVGPDTYMYGMKEFTTELPKIVQGMFFSDERMYDNKQSMHDVMIQEFTDMLLHENRRLSEDELFKELGKVEAGFITAVLQRVPLNGKTVAHRAKDLLFGDMSMAKRVSEIQRSENHPLKDNLWLQRLVPVIEEDRTSGMNDHIELLNKTVTKFDQYMLFDAFNELASADPDLARDLMYTAILQSGTINSPFEFLSMIPGSYFTPWVKQIFAEFRRTRGDMQYNGTGGNSSALMFMDDYAANFGWNDNIVKFDGGKRTGKNSWSMYTSKYREEKKVAERGKKVVNPLVVFRGYIPITRPGSDSRSFLNFTAQVEPDPNPEIPDKNIQPPCKPAV